MLAYQRRGDVVCIGTFSIKASMLGSKTSRVRLPVRRDMRHYSWFIFAVWQIEGFESERVGTHSRISELVAG